MLRNSRCWTIERQFIRQVCDLGSQAQYYAEKEVQGEIFVFIGAYNVSFDLRPSASSDFIFDILRLSEFSSKFIHVNKIYLDFPTPLSPIMRIFKVVKTSWSSIRAVETSWWDDDVVVPRSSQSYVGKIWRK